MDKIGHKVDSRQLSLWPCPKKEIREVTRPHAKIEDALWFDLARFNNTDQSRESPIVKRDGYAYLFVIVAPLRLEVTRDHIRTLFGLQGPEVCRVHAAMSK